MFVAKKIITLLLMPLPLCLILGLAGLALLWFSRRQHAGKALVAAALFLLLGASSPWVANRLVGSLERHHPPILTRQPGVKYIVVLGGGHVSEQGLPPTSRLTGSSLARLVEGIRLHRLHPGSKMLLSGGPVFDPVAEAVTMRAVALGLGVPARDIVIEDASRDTAEQAAQLAPLLRNTPFLLVTSASHLPRAMALFRGQGLTPTAAPTDYRVKHGERSGPGHYFPSAGSLGRTGSATHEYLGLAWSKVRSLLPQRIAP
ncbi:MAG: envelope biogenesis factor ElyC [Thermodesulfobacteriota bacterium]